MKRWDICDACHQSLPVNDVACRLCGIPLADAQTEVCGQCLQRPPPYQRCISGWRYEAPLDYLVHRLKFNKDLVFARLLAQMFAQHLLQTFENQPDRPEVIIPVPLHGERLRERGFNQAAEIAKVIARQLRLPLDLVSCTRLKPTLPQAELPAGERLANIKGAFAFRPLRAYQRVALVDDVMTTGHTLDELAKTIQQVSRCNIEVWVCARADYR